MKKFLLLLVSLFPLSVQAQHEMHGMTGMYGPYAHTRESSGTSWQPTGTPMDGMHWMGDDWSFMLHGFVTGNYDHQGGNAGDTSFFSANMLSGMLTKYVNSWTFGFRGMLSLEPLTVQGDGYPLLLQIGETADGTTHLINYQHPHDLFMELALTTSYALSDRSSIFAYFGLPGEPALGPPVFMHRASGVEIQEAPITHHWMDSTHITYGVGTLGFTWNNWKLDGSIFTGQEPDQHRWNIEKPTFDSYSGRLTFNWRDSMSLQGSYGYLNDPEQIDPIPHSQRIIFSWMHHKKWSSVQLDTTEAWARKINASPGNTLDSFLIETTAHLFENHIAYLRYQFADEDELLETSTEVETVHKITLGYTYDFFNEYHTRWGIGGLTSFHILPSSYDTTYGEGPVSFMVYLRMAID